MPRHPHDSKPLLTRRQALAWAAAMPWLRARGALAAPGDAPRPAGGRAPGGQGEYGALERAHGRILGVYALDTGSGRETGHRMDERFPFCSTFKAVLAAAILAQDAARPGLLARHIVYGRHDLASYSPITAKHADAGMPVADLCAAVVQYSDNTAANLLLHLLGGPPALTAYMRGIGNASFRLDRFEPALNTAIPGDLRDTSTPADMGRSLRDLVLGNALPAPAREQLKTWLLGNATGDRRIRAGTPAGWRVADKTGTGDYGTANDIAIVWPPARPPIVLAIYTTSLDKRAKANEELIAAATRVAIAELA